ncbi:hypothetical protein [Streptomyces halobius]|uniref:Uncharacterized protein n=1 Tax=Streptomyces halobius TaxID=2879846 RepID=A0ABY4MDJ3_9ACTN|nr:hypothetical protein [Streptomyces halobius]UQA95844.1 hypothetical protein K9S39_31800 [Streptomyces halobius]
MREQQRREQGKAAAWCGRLLLFAALIAGIVTMHTFGHPTGGHGGHATLSATVARAHATGPHAMDAHATGAHATNVRASGAHPMAVPPLAGHAATAHPTEARPTGHSMHHSPDHSATDTDGGAMDLGTVCRAALSFWVPALLVLLGAGVLLGHGEAGLPAALRVLLLRGPRPIPSPPRRETLARLSVLRV